MNVENALQILCRPGSISAIFPKLVRFRRRLSDLPKPSDRRLGSKFPPPLIQEVDEIEVWTTEMSDCSHPRIIHVLEYLRVSPTIMWFRFKHSCSEHQSLYDLTYSPGQSIESPLCGLEFR